MQADQSHQLLSHLLWTALLLCSPVLLVALIVGLVVSVIQVVTQIQDMSLSFVPKLIGATVALVVFGPWMLRTLLAYATKLILDIPRYL